MSKSTDIRIVEATCSFEAVPFRAPLKFGGRVVSTTDLMNVEVIVETRGAKHKTGFGSMPVGNVWAWPSSTLAPPATEQVMKRFLEEVIQVANEYPAYGHPIDLVYQISGEYEQLGKQLCTQMHQSEEIPKLAQLVAASPFDAALHDAYGKVNEQNSYNVLSSEYMTHDLSQYLDDSFAGEFLDQYTSRTPKQSMPLYHLVGALDPLSEEDVKSRIDDGLPETLGEWIAADGLTHMKIKLSGDNLEWDLNRVFAIDRIATEAQQKRNCSEWYYSCDFNEKCESVDYILEFLNKISASSAETYKRIQYVEQPTHRDLAANPQNKMHEAAKLKPIVIDESLVDYEALLLSRELGYSGVALKACKGQTEALLMGAAAQKFGLFLCVQDLTCPGASFLHSASIASRIPTVSAIEGNGRQYCPAPNKKWAKRYPGMFEISDGTVETGLLVNNGLGY